VVECDPASSNGPGDDRMRAELALRKDDDAADSWRKTSVT